MGSNLLYVGLIGATGYVGRGIASGLVQASKQDKLKLTILHRPNADTSRYPTGIETRVLDLEGTLEDIRQAVKGLQVVVSAISGSVLGSQRKLIEALEGSKELITFIPSDWATPILPEILQSGKMGYARMKEDIIEYARNKGVPCTPIANGTTPEILWAWPRVSAFNVGKNTATVFTPNKGGKRGLTSKRFTGIALAYLLTERLHDLPNKKFSLVEQPYSADDAIAGLTDYHKGKKPAITEYTQKDFEADLNRGDFGGPFRASGLKALSEGVEWPGEIINDAPGWKHKTLLEWIREAAEHPDDELEWSSAKRSEKP